MPLFRYEALAEGGKKISGVIDADNFLLAKERLRYQDLLVTKLSHLKETAKELSLPSSLLLAFTRELSQLLSAGLPLYESLLTIEEKYRRNKAHPLFLDLCDHLKGGSPLSTAFKKYPKTFDPVYLAMVKVAEQTGSLAFVFEQLSLLIARQQKLKKQLISALMYPSFLFLFCLVVVSSLLFFVVPSMQELFEDRALHPLTSVVLSLSKWLRENGIILALSLLGAVGLLTYSWRKKEMRFFWEKLLLRIPFFKTVHLQAILIRFCRCSSVLLSGGVPLIDTLALSRKAMRHLALEEVMEKAAKKIGEGQKLSVELKNSPLIPTLLIRMLAIAEETGKMAPMLHNVAEIYDEELERNLTQMTALLQPVLLLILGAIVGLVLLSILIPLTDVSSLTGGTL